MSIHTLARFLLPIGGTLTLIGYFGPWVAHPVAGLVITGLDLGEYVKFLAAVRGGEVTIWREGFYLPLVAASLALSLYAFDAKLRYGWLMRALLLGIAVIAALNMLPPAWSPDKLRQPEFRLQVVAIGICLGAMSVSPFLALVPRVLRGAFAFLLVAAAIWWPLSGFLRVLPAIGDIYNQPLVPGWGMYVMTIGLVIILIATIGNIRYAIRRNDQPATQSAG